MLSQESMVLARSALLELVPPHGSRNLRGLAHGSNGLAQAFDSQNMLLWSHSRHVEHLLPLPKTL
jgi:hypothetical protein